MKLFIQNITIKTGPYKTNEPCQIKTKMWDDGKLWTE